jgi:hypothetical protein
MQHAPCTNVRLRHVGQLARCNVICAMRGTQHAACRGRTVASAAVAEWRGSIHVVVLLTWLTKYTRPVLQQGATCCNTLQRVAAGRNMLQHITTCCSRAQRVATHNNVLQQGATCCNTLQRAAAKRNLWQQITQLVQQSTTCGNKLHSWCNRAQHLAEENAGLHRPRPMRR